MGSTTARGYGTQHQRTRKQWATSIKRGDVVVCRRASNGTCLAEQQRIYPGDLFDLGHPDETCPAPTAPEHRACNRATSRRDRRTARQAVVRRSRRW